MKRPCRSGRCGNLRSAHDKLIERVDCGITLKSDRVHDWGWRNKTIRQVITNGTLPFNTTLESHQLPP